MAFNISSKKIDLKKTSEGTWVNLSDDDEGGSVKVARFNNRKMAEFIDKKNSEYLKNNRCKKVPDEVKEEFVSEALSKFVLLDWKNVFISDFASDDEIKAGSMNYTPELGFKIFSDNSYEDFTNIVVEASVNIDNFRAEYSDDFKKN